MFEESINETKFPTYITWVAAAVFIVPFLLFCVAVLLYGLSMLFQMGLTT